MNNSNESLRFSRSYIEATGKPLHSRDYYEPDTIASKKEALFWVCVLSALAVVVYLLKAA